jgi:hypothetical protein
MSNGNKYVVTEMIKNLKELRDRTAKGDITALDEFFGLYIFSDGVEYTRVETQD